MPSWIENIKTHKPDKVERVIADCNVFVYAGYLPAGRHQFLIYSQERKQAFVKDIVIDLNSSDLYPEYPMVHEEVKENGGIER
mmetsp:Transcript_31894/g.48864  ORF Transcript_31894/g.48864 Transcript_31894/m.48864 type:complete len:83 (+) Transcript_31894:271-519(+)|eukprot:CAMPEP_0170512552 /NCGR_PEP_ID=MMETSP0208-20121228/66910_1 /TAXON_ID=197538 /ORGANISM="Strombidium inclinatum, Strain S3" /LENGTH=82 /DNA_ID=CAMNT_0010796195 /DNA_START=3713 /DNA_END=3961 /DNA_ORIENTATION=-